MSFQASIVIDSRTFPLEYYRSALHQPPANGKPGGAVRSGDIWFIIDGSNDDTFSAWMSDATAVKEGVINLYSYEQEDRIFKKIEFSGAYITNFYETFSIEKDKGDDDKSFTVVGLGDLKWVENQITKIQKSTGKNHLIAVILTAEKICIDGVNHINDWWT